MEFLNWLSNTGFATWVRESESIWAYPTVLFLHSLGMALLVGFIAAIDLRLVGLARSLPIAAMRRLLPLIWTGFWINAASGTLLLIIAPEKLRNPLFWIKLILIALGVVNLRMIERDVFGRMAPGSEQLPPRAAILGATSLAFWLGTITAGRLLAYIGNTR